MKKAKLKQRIFAKKNKTLETNKNIYLNKNKLLPHNAKKISNMTKKEITEK